MAAFSTTPATIGNDNANDSTQNRQRSEDEIIDGTGEEKQEPIMPGLTKELEKELIGIVMDYEKESYPTWRWLVRDCYESESFWKDLQIGFFDARSDLWRTPSIKQLANVGETGQRFNFFTNI